MNTLTKQLFVLSLTWISASAYAASHGQSPEHAYLTHWYSIDTAETTEIKLQPLNADAFGPRSTLSFNSDDGQRVNGIVAYPSPGALQHKLALVLHPMGSDQEFWWRETSPLKANLLTERLRKLGYTLISLDARRHGERAIEGFGPRELLTRAHSDEPRLYIDTIIGSVRDYRVALNWARAEFQPTEVLVVGYSMGAQMSLLLASYEPSINAVLTMVPPFVGSATSPVAPRNNIGQIQHAKVLWFAGSDDPYSNAEQTKEAFDAISSDDKSLMWFDGGHRLPAEYIDSALGFFDSLNQEPAQ